MTQLSKAKIQRSSELLLCICYIESIHSSHELSNSWYNPNSTFYILLLPKNFYIFKILSVHLLKIRSSTIYTSSACRSRMKYYVKSVQIRKYGNLRIQSECKKIWTRNNSAFGHFWDSEEPTSIRSIWCVF